MTVYVDNMRAPYGRLILPYPTDKAVRVTPFPERNTIEHWGDDPAAATRRAIVRAAAEIGART